MAADVSATVAATAATRPETWSLVGARPGLRTPARGVCRRGASAAGEALPVLNNPAPSPPRSAGGLRGENPPRGGGEGFGGGGAARETGSAPSARAARRALKDAAAGAGVGLALLARRAARGSASLGGWMCTPASWPGRPPLGAISGPLGSGSDWLGITLSPASIYRGWRKHSLTGEYDCH